MKFFKLGLGSMVVLGGMLAGASAFAGASPPAKPCVYSQKEVLLPDSYRYVCVVDGYNTYVVCPDGQFSKGTNGMVGGTLEHRAQWAFNQCPPPPQPPSAKSCADKGQPYIPSQNICGNGGATSCGVYGTYIPSQNICYGQMWHHGSDYEIQCADGRRGDRFASPDAAYQFCFPGAQAYNACPAGLTRTAGGITHNSCVCPSGMTPPSDYPNSPCSSGLQSCGGGTLRCPDGTSRTWAAGCGASGPYYTSEQAQASCPAGSTIGGGGTLPPLTGADLAQFQRCQAYCTNQKQVAQCGGVASVPPPSGLGPTGGESLVYQPPARGPTGGESLVYGSGSNSGGAGASASTGGYSFVVPNLVDERHILKDPSWQMGIAWNERTGFMADPALIGVNQGLNYTSLSAGALAAPSLGTSRSPAASLGVSNLNLGNVGALSGGQMFR